MSRLYFTCVPPVFHLYPVSHLPPVSHRILGTLYIPVSRISILYLSILQQIHCHCIPLYPVSHCIRTYLAVFSCIPLSVFHTLPRIFTGHLGHRERAGHPRIRVLCLPCSPRSGLIPGQKAVNHRIPPP